MSNKFTVWSGSVVPNQAIQGDPASESASIVYYAEDGIETTVTSPYELIEGKNIADLSFVAPEVQVDTVYSYYFMENIPDESPLIYPDPSNCDKGDCELPTFKVCPLGGEGS